MNDEWTPESADDELWSASWWLNENFFVFNVVCFDGGTEVNAEKSSPWDEDIVVRILEHGPWGFNNGICTRGGRFNDFWWSANDDSRIIGRKYRSDDVVDGRNSIQTNFDAIPTSFSSPTDRFRMWIFFTP